MFSLMKKYSKGYGFYAIITPILVVFEVLLEVLIPTLMAYIVDVAGQVATGRYQGGNEFWDAFFQQYPQFAEGQLLLWTLSAVCLVLALIALLCGGLAGYTVAKAGAGFSANLRHDLFKKIQSYSFANIDKFSTAGLVTRCTTDISRIQLSYMQLLRVVVRAPLMLVMATVFAFRLNAEISWIFLIAIPVLAIFMAIISTKTYPRFMRMLNSYDAMNGIVQENLTGIRVVKAFVREDYEQQKYDKSATEVRFAYLAAEKLMVFVNPVSMAVMFAMTTAIVYLGGEQIIAGNMESGALTGLVSYAAQILMSVMIVAFISIQLVLSRASIQRIQEALKETSEIADGDNDKQVGSGKIEFKDVNFSYSYNKDNLTLTDINLTINSGETVGIIGGTGEGKSSLVQLIPRLYDVLDGQILVDGTDVRDYKLHNLREGVSMVLQKNVLFSGTIEENLRWGNENATMDEIINACKIAQAHDFVSSFPAGYQTDLGQGGVNVSGGQKQRLCIARALLKKPKIMILDDSTSAVDTATDAKIREGLKKLNKDMTVIIIAQRINSIEGCDKIVVLDEGKIDAIGTHEQLLKNNKIYQEVYNSQQKGVAE